MSTVQPVEVVSVADHVERALRERILAGTLEPGARLHQEALSEELGVSRTPLREALGRLAADALPPPPAGDGLPAAEVAERLASWAIGEGGADNVTVALAPVPGGPGDPDGTENEEGS